MLKIVKVQNPALSHAEAQKLASSKLKELNAKLKETGASAYPSNPSVAEDKGKLGGTPGSGVVSDNTKKTPKEVSLAELVAAEKKIRGQVVDINRLIAMGRETIPEGEIVKHGKSGVNTLITFEDKIGNKLPVTGYFVIYI
jgi:hypothetical protein